MKKNPTFMLPTSIEAVEATIAAALRMRDSVHEKHVEFPIFCSVQARLIKSGLVISQSLKFSCENRILVLFPEVQAATQQLQTIFDTCLRYAGHGKLCLIPYAMYAAICDASQSAVPIPSLELVWSRISQYTDGLPKTIVKDEDLVSHLAVSSVPHFVHKVSEISLDEIDALLFSVLRHPFFSPHVTEDQRDTLISDLSLAIYKALLADVPAPAPAPIKKSLAQRIFNAFPK